MMRALRVVRAQLRASIATALQYRFDFAVNGTLALLWMGVTLVPLIVVFGAVRPALKAIGSQPMMVSAQAPAPAIESAASNRTESASSQLEGMRQIARADPATVANVVKAWVGDPKA